MVELEVLYDELDELEVPHDRALSMEWEVFGGRGMMRQRYDELDELEVRYDRALPMKLEVL